MLYRFRQGLLRRRFNRRVAGVFDTPPVHAEGGAGAPVLVSQLCRRDLSMYLLAVKSFARFVPLRAIRILDDGSLTAKDRALLDRHFPGIAITPLADAAGPRCPRGGTWERLLHIADQPEYVIQLDADTLTLADPVEVREAVRDSVSFTLGTGLGREIVPALQAAEAARGYPSASPNHVQLVSERAMDRLPDAAQRRYVRGNSGFNGFAPGSLDRAAVEEFSERMSALVGADKWNEWGSEQFTANCFVANSPGARVLPFPRYGYYDPKRAWESHVFLHFLGTMRFAHGGYAAAARRFLAEPA